MLFCKLGDPYGGILIALMWERQKPCSQHLGIKSSSGDSESVQNVQEKEHKCNILTKHFTLSKMRVISSESSESLQKCSKNEHLLNNLTSEANTFKNEFEASSKNLESVHKCSI